MPILIEIITMNGGHNYQSFELCLRVSNHILPWNVQDDGFSVYSTVPLAWHKIENKITTYEIYSSSTLITSSNASARLLYRDGMIQEYILQVKNQRQPCELGNPHRASGKK